MSGWTRGAAVLPLPTQPHPSTGTMHREKPQWVSCSLLSSLKHSFQRTRLHFSILYQNYPRTSIIPISKYHQVTRTLDCSQASVSRPQASHYPGFQIPRLDTWSGSDDLQPLQLQTSMIVFTSCLTAGEGWSEKELQVSNSDQCMNFGYTTQDGPVHRHMNTHTCTHILMRAASAPYTIRRLNTLYLINIE